MGGAKQMLL